MTIVKYCCYGGKTQKRTRIWHNLTHWKPACQWREGQGDRGLKNCKHCSYCNQGIKHGSRILRRDKTDKRPALQIEGFAQAARKNRIPTDLAEEWGKASVKQ